MAQKEEIVKGDVDKAQVAGERRISKKVSDHLANERTFLAWIRTGLATMAFGFAVERLGLVLRQLGVKGTSIPLFSIHYSSFVGVALVILGTLVMIGALLNFLQIRTAIDREEFHPQIAFAIVLTVLASLIGLVLIVYLLLTA